MASKLNRTASLQWPDSAIILGTTLTPVTPKRSELYNTMGDARIEVTTYCPSQQQTQTTSDTLICESLAIIFAIILFFATLPFSLLFCLKVIKEYQRAVILRLGRLNKREVRGPGLIFYLFCIDEVNVVDLRTIALNIPPQTVLTKDSVTTTVEAVVYYSVCDPISSCVRVKNCSNSTKLLATTILKNILGTKSLTEILSDKETISNTVRLILEDGTDNWGIRIERVEISDVKLPEQLQKVMAAEAEAIKNSRAKVLNAEGELRASRALKEASDIIKDNPTALQLRYLQTLNNIASNKTSTIVFPVPMDMFRRSGYGCNDGR